MTVSFPRGDPSTLLQGSPPPLPLVGAVVGASVAPRVGTSVVSSVGNGKGVFVARGVCVGASVGGRGVFVGTAAWVCATTVKAAATAVFCTSTGFAVGAAGAPQAVMIKVVAMTMVRAVKRFILYQCLLDNLAIRCASAF